MKYRKCVIYDAKRGWMKVSAQAALAAAYMTAAPSPAKVAKKEKDRQ